MEFDDGSQTYQVPVLVIRKSYLNTCIDTDREDPRYNFDASELKLRSQTVSKLICNFALQIRIEFISDPPHFLRVTGHTKQRDVKL